MTTGAKDWAGRKTRRKAWNKLGDEDILWHAARAAERCLADGVVVTIERLQKRGAVGDSSRITWAREQLIASGRLAAEACEGKNLPPSRPEIAAAAVRAAEALSTEPEREPTPIHLEIRAAMKRERERGKWTIAMPELAGA